MNNDLRPESSKESIGVVKQSESDLHKEKGDFDISLSVYNSYTVRRERKKGFRETGTPCSKADSSNHSIPTDNAKPQKESKQMMSPQVPLHKAKPQVSPLTIMEQVRCLSKQYIIKIFTYKICNLSQTHFAYH